MNNLKYAPDLKIGDLVLIASGSFLEKGIISSFTKSGKPKYNSIQQWVIDNYNKKVLYKNIILKRYVVKISDDLLTPEDREIYKKIKQLLEDDYSK